MPENSCVIAFSALKLFIVAKPLRQSLSTPVKSLFESDTLCSAVFSLLPTITDDITGRSIPAAAISVICTDEQSISTIAAVKVTVLDIRLNCCESISFSILATSFVSAERYADESSSRNAEMLFSVSFPNANRLYCTSARFTNFDCAKTSSVFAARLNIRNPALKHTSRPRGDAPSAPDAVSMNSFTIHDAMTPIVPDNTDPIAARHITVLLFL